MNLSELTAFDTMLCECHRHVWGVLADNPWLYKHEQAYLRLAKTSLVTKYPSVFAEMTDIPGVLYFPCQSRIAVAKYAMNALVSQGYDLETAVENVGQTCKMCPIRYSDSKDIECFAGLLGVDAVQMRGNVTACISMQAGMFLLTLDNDSQPRRGFIPLSHGEVIARVATFARGMVNCKWVSVNDRLWSVLHS